MSEEASEAKNKELRKARLAHTMKTSRYRSNFDLIKYLFMSSDPYISLLRKLPHKQMARHSANIEKDIVHVSYSFGSIVKVTKELVRLRISFYDTKAVASLYLVLFEF